MNPKQVKSIPFQLLMGNFRRKRILETIKNKELSSTEKSEMLGTYEDLIDKVLDGF